MGMTPEELSKILSDNGVHVARSNDEFQKVTAGLGLPIVRQGRMMVAEFSYQAAPPLFDCEVCGYRINRVRDSRDGSVTWVHPFAGSDDDHPVKPVRTEDNPDPRMVCDFCALPDPEWKIGVSEPVNREVLERRSLTLVASTQDIDKLWACCQPCKELIDAKNVDLLVERAVVTSLGRPENKAEIERVGQGMAALKRKFRESLYPLHKAVIEGRNPEADVWVGDPSEAP